MGSKFITPSSVLFLVSYSKILLFCKKKLIKHNPSDIAAQWVLRLVSVYLLRVAVSKLLTIGEGEPMP